MDPKVCLSELVEALRSGYDATAVERAGALLLWVLRGGALPRLGGADDTALQEGFAALADRCERRTAPRRAAEMDQATYQAPVPFDFAELRRLDAAVRDARAARDRACSALVAVWDRIDVGDPLSDAPEREAVAARNVRLEDAKAARRAEWTRVGKPLDY